MWDRITQPVKWMTRIQFPTWTAAHTTFLFSGYQISFVGSKTGWNINCWG
jgi:hypothetical protein